MLSEHALYLTTIYILAIPPDPFSQVFNFLRARVEETYGYTMQRRNASEASARRCVVASTKHGRANISELLSIITALEIVFFFLFR